MHRGLAKVVVWLAGWLCVPLAIAVPPQGLPAHAASAPGSLSVAAGKPPLCFDQLFYLAFPGKVNYCLGLRDWYNGHYRNGLEFLKLAAGWGNKDAQYTLGLIYYGGHHVAADPALGIAWLKLADERHNDRQIMLAAQSAAQWATPAQRKQADRLFHRMRATYGDSVAAARAWRRLQRWQDNHGPFVSGCVGLRGAQAEAALHAGLARPTQNGACVPIHKQLVVVRMVTDHYFRGLVGTVTVEPLKPVPAPAASSGH